MIPSGLIHLLIPIFQGQRQDLEGGGSNCWGGVDYEGDLADQSDLDADSAERVEGREQGDGVRAKERLTNKCDNVGVVVRGEGLCAGGDISVTSLAGHKGQTLAGLCFVQQRFQVDVFLCLIPMFIRYCQRLWVPLSSICWEGS